MKRLLLFVALTLFASQLTAQDYSATALGTATTLYGQTLSLQSEALGESIEVNLQLPEEWFRSDEMRFPCLVLFDQQHAMTYPFLIHAIDLLIANAQIPRMIVVGIPFAPEERFALTDPDQKADAMARFLTDELFPLLHDEYKAQKRPMVAGHSRTGFFASYLTAHYSEYLSGAISLSSFFEEGFLPEDVRMVMQRLEKRETPFHWYIASGTSIEDATYAKAHRLFVDSLDRIYARRPQEICRLRLIDHTNHMTSYMQGLQWALIEHYKGYERILSSWLHEKGDTIAPQKALSTLASDFRELSESLGYTVNPAVIHFWSIGSQLYYGGHKAAFAEFIELARKVYPTDYSFAEEQGLIAVESGDFTEAEASFRTALALLNEDPLLNDAEKSELRKALEEQLQSAKDKK
jgi:enterochelin esterase-like enzyme